MSTTFVSAITDEAIQRICYTGGGWDLNPFHFIVSETNVLDGITIFNPDGTLTEAAKTKLTSLTTEDISQDLQNWFESPFSAVTKSSKSSTESSSASSTLAHHIVIPANASNFPKNINTIYFLYKEHNTGDIFLYAVAVATEELLFEPGVTQSLFFNFTIQSASAVPEVNFVINYTYPSDIADHNTSEDVHNNLVRRDGSLLLTGTLMYNGNRTFTGDYQLVSKEYVDQQIRILKLDNNLR